MKNKFIILVFGVSSGNTSTRSWRNGVVVNGTLNINSTWGNDLPYIMENGSLTVPSGKTLTMNPGTVVKFDGTTSAQLVVDGTLNVKGTTSTHMIYFTSIKDDSIGGDTNNDGTSTSPAGGDWADIQLDSGSSSTLNYASIRYGGGLSPNPEIYLSDKLTAWHTTIASSSYYGVYVTGSGTLNIASSSIINDSGDGVDNSTNVTSSATAQQNWWGSSAGPYNANSNPSGTMASPVSDYVTYSSWLNSAP
jgi:hypothetical protein